MWPFPNPMDMLIDWLYERIEDGMEAGIEYWRQFIENPPSPAPDSEIMLFLAGEGWGLASMLAIIVFMVSVFWVVISTRGIDRALSALLVAIIVGVGGSAWFFFIDELGAAMSELVEAARFYTDDPSASQYHETPEDPTPIGFVIRFGSQLMLGVILFLIIIWYQAAMLALRFLFLPLAVLKLSGKIGETTFRMAVSTLVAALLGPALAVLSLEFGMIAVDHFPIGDTNFGAGLYALSAIFAAILWQFLLFWGAYVQYSKVVNKTHSLVRGKVGTEDQTPHTRVDIQQGNAVHNASVTTVRVAHPQPTSGGDSNVTGTVARGVGAVGAATGHPYIAGAGHAVDQGSKFNRERRRRKQTKRRS